MACGFTPMSWITIRFVSFRQTLFKKIYSDFVRVFWKSRIKVLIDPDIRLAHLEQLSLIKSRFF